ncbi:hypothetical protein C7431_11146 [Pantoea allii]|uniref:Uncharacterized protein n=1 Tax=Pantoea allii TaxID=574096 RepID=A0A2V2BD20_9GAMM|nr:hypothetical protein C7431_11146 [Pantoea allii]
MSEKQTLALPFSVSRFNPYHSMLPESTIESRYNLQNNYAVEKAQFRIFKQ